MQQEILIQYLPQNSSGPWMLEAQVSTRGEQSREVVIICHPHPLFGGNMYNNVVIALYDGLSDDFVTVRFNFSGVGNSEGVHENGHGEIEQVRAVIDYFTSEYIEKNGIGRWKGIHVVGYSFGALVGGPAATSMDDIKSFSGVAFPFDLDRDLSEMTVKNHTSRQIPLFFLIGTRDEYTSMNNFNSWVKLFHGETVTEIIKGANHFFNTHENAVLNHVRHFLKGINRSEK